MGKVTWRQDTTGRWVKEGDGTAAATGRPKVSGASASKAPGSATEPCPLATIKVIVKRADNQTNVAGVEVQASGPGGGQATTNGQGQATFEKVPPGAYQVSVIIPERKQFDLVEPEPYRGPVEPSSTTTITIEVEPLAAVQVTVKDQENGKGVEGIAVALVEAGGARHEGGRTAGNGTAAVKGVPRGTYTVAVTLEPPLDGQFQPPKEAPAFEVTSGDPHALEVALAPLGTQTVNVRRKAVKPGGATTPLEKVGVQLTPAGNAAVAETTDHEGLATLTGLVPGEYTLTLDLGTNTGRYQPLPETKLSIKARGNPEKTIELVPVWCDLKSVTISEKLARGPKATRPGSGTKAGRTFFVPVAGGVAAPSNAIEVAARTPIHLVAPRRADLLAKPDSKVSLERDIVPEDSDLLGDNCKPVWLQFVLDCTPHIDGSSDDGAPNHPRLRLRTHRGETVRDQPGKVVEPAVVWGPDYGKYYQLGTEKGNWLRRLGLQFGELIGILMAHDQAAEHWRLDVDHCDEDGNGASSVTDLKVYPSDEYEFSVNIPAVASYAHGRNGDYIKGADTTTSNEVQALGGTVAKEQVRTTGSGTETERVADQQKTVTKPGSDPETADAPWASGTSFGKLVFAKEPLFDLKRNGAQDPAFTRLTEFGNLILWGCVEAKDFFGDTRNITPKFGWWFTFDVSLLAVSITGVRKWQAAEKANAVEAVSELGVKGRLLALKFGIKAGVEGTVVPRAVYFYGVIYAELAGAVDVELKWAWATAVPTAAKRTPPREQKVTGSCGFQIGVDVVIGNANFCQAKAWIEVPYTIEVTLVPPGSTDKAKWRHGFKEGIHAKFKYCLFYGKYSGTKRLELREPVAFDD